MEFGYDFKKGQVYIDGKVYQVEFEPVTDKVSIDKFIDSYRQRSGYSWDPAWEKKFRPTVMRLKFWKSLEEVQDKKIRY